MLTKNDFTAEDWATLRETPHLVGIATMIVGSSGLGTIKESVAAAQTVMEGQASQVPVIRDLSNRPDVQAAQESLKGLLGNMGSDAPAEKIQNLALERVRASLGLLAGKASPEESKAFRAWLSTIAETVAKAAKEGGFLGFGGTQVSDAEQTFLNNLNTALQGDDTLAAAKTAGA